MAAGSEKALAGGVALTRKELSEVLAASGVEAEGLRLGAILMHAELEQLVCSGPRRGKQQTYALLEERAPTAVRMDRDAALAELCRRFFNHHGPATAKDLAWWSSLTVAEVTRGLDIIRDEVERLVFDDATYWYRPSAPFPRLEAPTVHLLQPYDEYVVAFADSRRVYDPAGLDAAKRPERGAYNGIVLLDAHVAGNWKRTVKRRDVVIDLQLYRRFDDSQMAALRAAADAYASFLGRTATLNDVHVL